MCLYTIKLDKLIESVKKYTFSLYSPWLLPNEGPRQKAICMPPGNKYLQYISEY